MVAISLFMDVDTGNGDIEVDVWYGEISNHLKKTAQLSALYEPIWNPKFKIARSMIKLIESGLEQLNNPDMKSDYDKCSPERSYYSHSMLVRFTEDYLKALKDHPRSKIKIE